MGGLLVVKVGGSTLGSHDTTLADIARLAQERPVVVVHGGGAAVSDVLKRAGHEVRFHNGLRVTDPFTLETLIAVVAGQINTRLVAQLNALGAPAVGLTGVDGGLLGCEAEDPDLGLVGSVVEVRPAVVEALTARGLVPVVAPVGVLQREGEPTEQALNLNADTVAGQLAAGVGAEALALLTDIEGVRDATGEVVRQLTGGDIDRLIAEGVISGGMIPKVSAAMVAVQAGLPAVIADGRRAGGLPAALAGEAGTRVVP